MIAYGTRIRVLRAGLSMPVQELEPGGLVYDPLADEHRVIEDILERCFTPEDIASDWFEALYPLRIQPGVLGHNTPSHALVVSPRQGLVVRIDDTGPHLPAVIGLVDGRALKQQRKAQREVLNPNVKHRSFALLFAQEVTIEANGALLRAYNINEFDIRVPA